MYTTDMTHEEIATTAISQGRATDDPKLEEMGRELLAAVEAEGDSRELATAIADYAP